VIIEAHPEKARSAVSKDEACEVSASWFETRSFAALLTKRIGV
jgi:hypothetical protein